MMLDAVSCDPVVAKLHWLAGIPDAEASALCAALSGRVRTFGRRAEIVRQGSATSLVHVVVSGWTCRYKRLPGGRRQILALQLPGDVCAHHAHRYPRLNHGIATLSAARVAEIDPTWLDSETSAFPRLAEALRRDALVDAATKREWMLNLGCRSALERVSHLACELLHRLRTIGLAEDNSFDLPMTQADLAEATGLTSVHINRVLNELRRRGLIHLKRHRLTIKDLAALERLAMFDPGYLQVRSDVAAMHDEPEMCV